MDANNDARETANVALRRLLELRTSTSPSISDLAAIASEVRVPSGSGQTSANKSRADA